MKNTPQQDRFFKVGRFSNLDNNPTENHNYNKRNNHYNKRNNHYNKRNNHYNKRNNHYNKRNNHYNKPNDEKTHRNKIDFLRLEHFQT
jgi:hypothetical protein